jgi:hypothetical protein
MKRFTKKILKRKINLKIQKIKNKTLYYQLLKNKNNKNSHFILMI